MIWPSNRPWSFQGPPEPDWPSASWDDPHFGRPGPDASREALHDGDASPPADQPRENAGEARQTARQVAPNVKTRQGRLPPSQSPISLQELEAMVSELGLAGTVEQVMGRTGLGFKDAAKLISKVRSQR